MKMIIAIIQPFMLNKLTSELEMINDFPGMTVSDVRGFGRRVDSQGKQLTELQPYHAKTRVEIAVREEMVETVVEKIKRFARTGNHGDGKIFVIPVESALRIRTGERDEDAI